MWGGRKLAVGTGAETAGVGENRPLCSLRGRTDSKQSGAEWGCGEGSSTKPQTVTFAILSY